MSYYNISVFTVEKYKQAIIDNVLKTSLEEVPTVWLVEFEGDEGLLKWIDGALNEK